VASNLAKRLDRLERLAGALLSTNQGPVYCREGEEPEGVAIERLVCITRSYVSPPERDELVLTEEEAPIEEPKRAKPERPKPLSYPKVGYA
jgi:hypothetical protein